MQTNETQTSSSTKPGQFPQKLTPKMWKREEVLTFLDIYEASFLQSNNESDDELWNTVSLKLAEHDIQVSPAHCKSKWNLLYKAYTANPDSQGTFFKKVKQIVETTASIDATDEIEETELFKEERLEIVSEDEVDISENTIEAPQAFSDSLRVERVTDATFSEAEGVIAIIEKLCCKIDDLSEMQHRQEERIEEIYQIQRANHAHLLEIKKHLNIT
uniref:Myb/SANT-like DNA-binding domain-containing protein n=1 Tax=Anopheles culicifacies TaxID=139723 RepID=A0A182M3K9_9DIPT